MNTILNNKAFFIPLHLDFIELQIKKHLKLKKLLLFIAISMLGLGMTSCQDAKTDFLYSISRGGGVEFFGDPAVYAEKSAEYEAYLETLAIPKEILVIKAKNREEANKEATAWFNSFVIKVDNAKVNSFAPVKFYLTFQLSTLLDNADSFTPIGELKEFGDLSIKKQ